VFDVIIYFRSMLTIEGFFWQSELEVFTMISVGSAALKWTSAVFLHGAQAIAYARGMGFIPAPTFQDAIQQAERIVG
jgi:hypothetical protein